MTSKYTLIPLSFLFLYSCSLLDSSKIAPGYIEAIKTIKAVIVGEKNDSITPGLVKSIPYASSTLQIGKGAPGLIILESISGNEETWVSSDGIYLVFKEGRIIQTKGFYNNLVSLKSQETNSKKLVDSGRSETFFYYYSYDEPKLINMKVNVERRFVRKESVQLLGYEKQLNLIEERIENDYIGWRATNKFWVDDEMFIWKSHQSISPKLPEFYIEVTKKPAK